MFPMSTADKFDEQYSIESRLIEAARRMTLAYKHKLGLFGINADEPDERGDGIAGMPGRRRPSWGGRG